MLRENKIAELITQISEELSLEKFQKYDEIKLFLSMGKLIKKNISKYDYIPLINDSTTNIKINNCYDAVIKKVLPYGLLAKISIDSSSDILVFCVKKGNSKFKEESKIKLKIVKSRKDDIKVPFTGEILDNIKAIS